MYLTRITVDFLTVQHLRLFDGYKWKQELYRAFTPIESGRPFLFDIKEKGDKVIVLLLSELQPKVLPFGTWETKAVRSDFYDGTRYAFEIVANPTVKHTDFDEQGNKKSQGRREGIRPEYYGEWLKKKFESAGCEACNVSVQNLGTRVSHHKGALVTHSAAKFLGTIIVKDSVAFKVAATKGIGSAKSFGFGLLLLKRI